MRQDFEIRRCPGCYILSRWYDGQCQICLRQRQERVRSAIIVVAAILIFAIAVYRVWIGGL